MSEMTSQTFLKKWLMEQAPTRRDDFIADVVALLTPPDHAIWVESTGSHRDLRGLVTVKIGTYSFQVEPPEARKIGRDFLEAAHACELDAFLYQFLGNGEETPPRPLDQLGMLVS